MNDSVQLNNKRKEIMLSKLMKNTVLITMFAIIAGCGDSEPQQAPVTFNKEKTFILKGLLFNTADLEVTRIIACDVAFEFNNEDMTNYFLTLKDENKFALEDKIKKEISLLVRSRTYQQVMNKEGRGILSNQIKKKVNNIFLSHFKENKNMMKWKIENVYFPRFTN